MGHDQHEWYSIASDLNNQIDFGWEFHHDLTVELDVISSPILCAWIANVLEKNTERST
jgi:hypothetical protein